MQRGFTLIETLVYIGLLALIMVGLLGSTFNILQTTDKTKMKAEVQEEGDFLLGKLNSALTGASSVSSVSGNILTLSQCTPTCVTLDLRLSGSNFQFQRGVNPSVILNNSNVTVTPTSGSIFTHTGSGTSQEFVTVSFTLNSKAQNGQFYTQNFQTTKYVRK